MIYKWFQIVRILLLASLLLFFGAALVYFFCVDRLIRFQYKNYREQWIRDGRPYGYFWTSKESSFWLGCFSREACVKKWLEEKPDWIQEDAKAVDRLNWIRRAKSFMYFSMSICGVILLVFLLFKRAGFEL